MDRLVEFYLPLNLLSVHVGTLFFFELMRQLLTQHWTEGYLQGYPFSLADKKMLQCVSYSVFISYLWMVFLLQNVDFLPMFRPVQTSGLFCETYFPLK